MRTLALSLLSALVSFGCGASSAAHTDPEATSAPDVRWQTFRPDGEEFTLEMPGAPVASQQQTAGERGTVFSKLFMVDAETTLGAGFIVTVTSGGRFAAPNASANEIYDLARDGALAGTHGTLVSEAPVHVSGLPGREVMISMDGGQNQIRERLVFLNHKLYSIVIMAQAAATARLNEIANHYLDSFRLLTVPEGD
ncbi:MAG: hypothetical protein IPK60_02295 [Sandaracinaceae bacterium]|nr:hypothetical protein [Sandaracinaceae bacterium]